MDYMKTPCDKCPYRMDVKPFLHPRRGEQLAYHVQNPYNSFSCHKTLERDSEGETFEGKDTKQCAGFMTLQASELERDNFLPEGFKPSYELVYEDTYAMVDAYDNQD